MWCSIFRFWIYFKGEQCILNYDTPSLHSTELRLIYSSTTTFFSPLNYNFLLTNLFRLSFISFLESFGNWNRFLAYPILSTMSGIEKTFDESLLSVSSNYENSLEEFKFPLLQNTLSSMDSGYFSLTRVKLFPRNTMKLTTLPTFEYK